MVDFLCGRCAAAKTKKQQRDWFIAHGFTEVDFIGGTTLPERDLPAPPVPYSGGFPSSNMRAIADDEVNRLFAKFFSSWATTRQFDSLVLNYVSPQHFGGDPTTGERKAADRSCDSLPGIVRSDLALDWQYSAAEARTEHSARSAQDRRVGANLRQ